MAAVPHFSEAASDMAKIPPHSNEAEQAVLGGLLLDPEALDKIADELQEGDFYRRDHRVIFRAICALANDSKPYDAVTLSDWFEVNDAAQGQDLAGYILELTKITPSAANIEAYAKIVRDRSHKRQLISVSTTTLEEAWNPAAPDSVDLLAEAEQRIFHIAEMAASKRKHVVGMTEAAKAAFQILSDRYQNRGQLTGVATGFPELDKLTAGLQPADLVIVAARPSMGKTAFAMNIAEHAAFYSNQSVAVFSMEMSHAQLAFRLIASLGKINMQHLRTGEIAEEEWPHVTDAITTMSQSNRIFIDDTPALSPAEMRSRARRLHREHGIGLVVVDYLQLMHVPGTRENRTNEIAEISRGLKALAKELNVPVVALSQLNRSLEQRADKRPLMSDLRESGAIEQDADVIIFLYRDEYYNKDSDDSGKAEVIIGKQRNGPTDRVKLAFFGKYSRFESLSDNTYDFGEDDS